MGYAWGTFHFLVGTDKTDEFVKKSGIGFVEALLEAVGNRDIVLSCTQGLRKGVAYHGIIINDWNVCPGPL